MRFWPSIIPLLLFSTISLGQLPPSAAIKAATSDGWPPYEYYDPDTQKMTGYSTEVIRSVLAKMKRPLSPVRSLPWVRAQNMLFRGDIDLLYSATPSPNRLKLGRVSSEPIATSYWVLFVLTKRQQQLNYHHLNDLAGYKIGTVKGYTYTPEFWQMVREQAFTNSVLTDTQNFKMLVQKRVDFVIAELANGLEIIHQLGIEHQVTPLSHTPVRITTLHAVFSRKNVSAETVEKFSQQLKEFKQTEQHRQLYQKFFHHLDALVIP